jgi:hypothetical protein|tara:strand:+ start:778 stop:975 length:198 start_codon:yes stop_codon:yes gene_type:complete
MTVRKLKAKQRGPWCSYCGERATHTRGHQKHSCTYHLPDLRDFDLQENKKDSYQTEGEWQALGRW